MGRIGVTGHQRLHDPNDWMWVAKVVKEQINVIPQPIIVASSLAIGADQLVSRCVVERGGQIHAILPFADIERSFPPEQLPHYRELLKLASTVEIIGPCESDEDAYLAAGKRVVDLSEKLIAVWNGMPAKGKGGTADIVAYARMRGVPLIHINPLSHTVQGPLLPKNWL